MAANDYGGVLSIVVTGLKARTALTTLLATRNIAGTSSKANSIFYATHAPLPPLFPCIAMRDFGPFAADPTKHELPMLLCRVAVELSIFGRSQDIRAIQSEIDLYLESAEYSGALDTASWAIKDIDTSGGWVNVQVPKELTADGSTTNLEQRAKTFDVVAANKLD